MRRNKSKQWSEWQSCILFDFTRIAMAMSMKTWKAIVFGLAFHFVLK